MSDCKPIYKCCNTDLFAYNITSERVTWWNTEQSASCPEGSEGDSVIVPAHTFHSYTSQEDADARALAAAENALECIWWNEEQVANCPDGTCGDSVTVNAHTVSSGVSQSDANAIALQQAEDALSCDSSPLCTDCGGSADWPTEQSGIPYSNSGNNVTDFTDYLATSSTTGSVIDITGAGYTAFPSTSVGDFTISMEVYTTDDAARTIGFGLSDTVGQQHFIFTITDGSEEYNEVRCFLNCSRESLYSNLIYGTQIAPNQIPPSTWGKITLKRVGDTYSFLINDVDTGATFSGVSGIDGAVLCLITDSVNWNIRNISIT